MKAIYQVITKIDNDGCWDKKSEHTSLERARKAAIEFLKDIYDRVVIEKRGAIGRKYYRYPLYLWKDGLGNIFQTSDEKFIEIIIN